MSDFKLNVLQIFDLIITTPRIKYYLYFAGGQPET